MKKRQFESELFLRTIKPDEEDFWLYVIAECLFRLNDKNVKNCECQIHTEQRERLKTALDKALKIRIGEFQRRKHKQK